MRQAAVLAGAAILLSASFAPAEAVKPKTGFNHAFAHSDCAPWDGGALRIVLQNEPVAAAPNGQLPAASNPHYEIRIWMRVPPVKRWLTFPGKGEGKLDVGRIGYFAGPSPMMVDQRGRVWLEEFTPTHVSGEMRIGLPGFLGRELVYPFSAKRIVHQTFCG